MHTFWSMAQSTSVRAAGQTFFLYGASIPKIGAPREPGPHQSGSTSPREAQGHSVFQFNTNEGQCQVRLGREAAARGRNVGVACPSQQSNRGIA